MSGTDWIALEIAIGLGLLVLGLLVDAILIIRRANSTRHNQHNTEPTDALYGDGETT